jgi:hypothetical protein
MYPCRVAQVICLPQQARSRRHMGPEERSKSDGITIVVYRFSGDA